MKKWLLGVLLKRRIWKWAIKIVNRKGIEIIYAGDYRQIYEDSKIRITYDSGRYPFVCITDQKSFGQVYYRDHLGHLLSWVPGEWIPHIKALVEKDR